MNKVNVNIADRVWFYLLVFLFFFLDICFFSLFSVPTCYLVFYLYLYEALSSRRIVSLGVLSVFLFLEFFLYTGGLTGAAAYGVGALIGAFCLRQAFYPDRFLFASIAIGGLLVQTFIVEGFILSLQAINYYTFLKIAVNLILIGLFSLKLRFQGNLDNRYL
jgi:hypothetical protein